MNDDTKQANQAAVRAMSAGDLATAQAILVTAVTRDPRSLTSWLNLAAVRRQLNDLNGAYEALRQALTLDPRNFPALLMVASLLEREGNAKAAAAAYGIALVQAPPDSMLNPAMLAAVNRGRELHRRHTEELDGFIRSKVADHRSQCPRVVQRRIDTFIATTLRTSERYQQQPTDYYFPGLPPIEFFEREQFPWLEELEAATPDVQRELAAILQDEGGDFSPYVHYQDHLPLDQWRELNNSPRWTAFHFYHLGKPVPERVQRAPLTFAAVSRLPQPDVALRSPVALFSRLLPHTRIPPHHGVANFRLLVHLPLILPGQCYFRVGGETREWRMGEAWVFDDTIEHEAWNDSDHTRVIMICDIWNPHLSEEEREAIARVIAANDEYNGTVPDANA
ncbi:MAG: aspartyl/asparaginyl beta-hydroxylase domain-containing protein [Gammaproteobacteria bacterium]|nr:aspartyl/asparaginyl beta-hydroxylase domain-containing protein [Gammaproteobacteria bacterium]